MSPKGPVYSVELPDGTKRWVIEKSYRGHRIHERHRTKGRAETRYKNWLIAVDNRELGHAEMTVEELAAEWLEHKRLNVSGNTFRDYAALVDNKIIPELGNLELSELHPMLIQGFVDEIAAASPDQANKCLVVLRQMLSQAIRWNLCHRNPAKDVNRATINRADVRTLTRPEALRLTSAASGREKAIITLALGCGLREGEVFALEWEDIGWDAGRVRISKSLESRQVVKMTKTNRTREVPVPTWTIEALRGWHQAQGEPEEGVMFSGRDGGHMDAGAWYRRNYRPLVKSLGLDVTFHALRHTYAMLLLADKVDNLTLSRFLGHSTIRTTFDHYGHMMGGGEAYRGVLDSLLGETDSTISPQREKVEKEKGQRG